MRRLTLFGSTALGVVLGGILFNAAPSLADMPVIDVTSILKETGILDVLNTMNSVETSMQNAINTLLGKTGPIATALGPTTYGDVSTLLRQGFTQEANYSKASVGAQQNIADASNTIMAQQARNLRDAQIRDEQTASPTACANLDGGVATQSAAVQGYKVGAVIAAIHDLRGEAGQGMPSHFGQAEAVASMSRDHNGLYCDAEDAAALNCPLSQHPDADQQMLSLFGSGTYADQNAVNMAKDYAVNLIEPIAPAALRGDQLSSTTGQDAAVRRRSYNARMSLAQSFVDNTIGMQTPSVPLTPLQQQYLQELGLPSQTNGSWLQVLQIESERRISSVSWNAEIQAIPPASVVREIALELAMNNYLLFQNFKLNLKHTTIDATRLAEETDHEFQPAVRMPTPSIAAN